MRRPSAHCAWLMLGAVVVLAACGGEAGSSPPPRDDTGSTATAAPSAAGAAARLAIRSDLVDPQVVAWTSWHAVDPTTLEFTVTAGAPDCYAAASEVVESETEVRVRLRVGRLPEAADRDCQAIALESVVPARLAKPLGARRVEPLS